MEVCGKADIKSNVELSGMDSRIKIRDAIQAGKVQEATLMVHQMYPELLDDDRYLFFHLQVSKKIAHSRPELKKMLKIIKL